MAKHHVRYRGIVAVGGFAALLVACASEGDSDNAGQDPPSPQTTDTAAVAGSDLAEAEAQLRAARGSVGAAKSGVRSCFDALGACAADAGAVDQACLDQLEACLPKAPPPPLGCPTLPEPTAEQIAAADEVVGDIDDLAEDVLEFAGEVEEAVGPVLDDLADNVDQVVGAILDGGIPLPPGPRGGSGFGGRNKNGGASGGAGLPPISADATLGGGEICGVPLPNVPIGELKACADQAAAELEGGADLFAVAANALSCVEAPFQDDIAALCGDATSQCEQPGAPANICAHVSAICAELTAP